MRKKTRCTKRREPLQHTLWWSVGREARTQRQEAIVLLRRAQVNVHDAIVSVRLHSAEIGGVGLLPMTANAPRALRSRWLAQAANGGVMSPTDAQDALQSRLEHHQRRGVGWADRHLLATNMQSSRDARVRVITAIREKKSALKIVV